MNLVPGGGLIVCETLPPPCLSERASKYVSKWATECTNEGKVRAENLDGGWCVGGGRCKLTVDRSTAPSERTKYDWDSPQEMNTYLSAFDAGTTVATASPSAPDARDAISSIGIGR